MSNEHKQVVQWLIDAESKQKDFQPFPQIYSPKYGMAWADNAHSDAELFFFRTYPELVNLLQSKEYQAASQLEKLRMLGYETKGLKDERHVLFYDNLEILEGGVVAGFRDAYKELFIQKWQTREQELREFDWEVQHNFLKPSVVMNLQVCYTSSPFHEFNEHDGSETP